MKKVKISREEAAEIFWGVKVPKFMAVEFFTVKSGEKLKPGCPYPYITQREQAIILTGFNPKDENRGWGTRLSNALLCHYKNNAVTHYLTFRRVKTIKVSYRSGGIEIPECEAQKWLVKSETVPFKQELKLENIFSFKTGGITREIGA